VESSQVFLIGVFNDWQNTTPLTSEGFGRWALFVKDKAPQISMAARHGSFRDFSG